MAQPTPHLEDNDENYVCHHGNPTFGQWPGDFCWDCWTESN